MAAEGHSSSPSLNASYAFYPHVFSFESEFDPWAAKQFCVDYGFPLVATSGVLYLLMVFGGSALMASRAPFQLRGLLAAWSSLLAIFSICGFVRTAPELVHTLMHGGLRDSVCGSSFLETNRASAFWMFMFVLSKLPELGDTLFIVLRKQKLIFLHWYHHLTVLIYVFYCFSDFNSCSRWFGVMNLFVHSLMYSYYALKALRVRIPGGVALLITSLQLLQMAVGCTVTYLAWSYKSQGIECRATWNNLTYGSLMYLSYFLLFARFFYEAYLGGGRRKETLNGGLEGRKEK